MYTLGCQVSVVDIQPPTRKPIMLTAGVVRIYTRLSILSITYF